MSASSFCQLSLCFENSLLAIATDDATQIRTAWCDFLADTATGNAITAFVRSSREDLEQLLALSKLCSLGPTGRYVALRTLAFFTLANPTEFAGPHSRSTAIAGSVYLAKKYDIRTASLHQILSTVWCEEKLIRLDDIKDVEPKLLKSVGFEVRPPRVWLFLEAILSCDLGQTAACPQHPLPLQTYLSDFALRASRSHKQQPQLFSPTHHSSVRTPCSVLSALELNTMSSGRGGRSVKRNRLLSDGPSEHTAPIAPRQEPEHVFTIPHITAETRTKSAKKHLVLVYNLLAATFELTLLMCGGTRAKQATDLLQSPLLPLALLSQPAVQLLQPQQAWLLLSDVSPPLHLLCKNASSSHHHAFPPSAPLSFTVAEVEASASRLEALHQACRYYDRIRSAITLKQL